MPSGYPAGYSRAKGKLVGLKTCTRCQKPKAPSAFGDRSDRPGTKRAWCKTCVNISSNERSRTDEYKLYVKEYVLREDVSEKRRAYDRSDRKRRLKARYYHTPRGKLMAQRAQYRRKLRVESDPERRNRLELRIAMINMELVRMEKSLECEETGVKF
jgi:hypothetical protein